jgi:hypothetical protein
MHTDQFSNTGIWAFFLAAALALGGCHSGQKPNGQTKGEPSEQVTKAYYKYFQGTVGHENTILQLIKYADRYDGTLIDGSSGRPLPVSGHKDSSGDLLLVSYNHYNPVDTLRGSFPQPGVFQGQLSDTAGQQRAFTLQEIYPPGTLRWQVYTLSDSLSLDSSENSSPKARVQLMLLWPDTENTSAPSISLLKDSITKNYYGIDSSAMDPAAVLESARDTFFASYTQLQQQLKDRSGSRMAASFNWESDVEMKILWNAGNRVSIAYENYQYTGGAHGLGNTLVRVFDVTSGKTLTIQDVFKPGYESSLRQVLEKHLRVAYDIPEGSALNGDQGILFDPHLALTRNFYLTGNGVGFIYNPYEVAPYVVGSIELFIPFSEIREIVQPAFLEPGS